MKPGIPWSVKGIEPEVREAAKHAAKRAGMTLGEWLNTVILDQNEQNQPDETPAPRAQMPAATLVTAEAPIAPPPRPQARRDDSSLRLEDIANQLAALAQREREAATVVPYEAAPAPVQDQQVIDRILDRIDSNERQAVDAFNAMNERLSLLGRHMAAAPRSQPVFEKPEDVPGFSALEHAIRNVVEHIEVSEQRTRDSLKSMQDRLSEMAERAAKPGSPDELLRSAPAFTGLEHRLADISNRLQRSENLLSGGLPDVVRKELSQLTERIESVKSATEAAVEQAQASATGTARQEVRSVESRILSVLKEAQTMIGVQQSASADMQKMRGEMSTLAKRIDEVRGGSATERDVHALRVAVEQLSTRVAQGPDMRPIADMDRRLGELSRKLEQSQATPRHLPQVGELERRIAELDHKLEEVMQMQGDRQMLEALEQNLAAVNDRVGRTEDQLGHLETMERAIHQLYESLEGSRAQVAQTAEEAANRAVERVLAAQVNAGPSPELRAMEEGLRAVRESAAHADQRNQETLEAVHETLEQIVNKLAELETASAGHQLAANLAQQAAAPVMAPEAPAMAQPAPDLSDPSFFDPTGMLDQQIFEPPVMPAPAPAAPVAAPVAAHVPPQPVHVEVEAAAPVMPDFSTGAPQPAAVGDDFIAAARRAAQAAASRPAALQAEARPQAEPEAAAKSGFSLAKLFKGSKALPDPVVFVNGKPVNANAAAGSADSKRKKLVLAGIVLLAAVSAFAFNMLSKPKAPKAASTIEMVAPPAVADLPADDMAPAAADVAADDTRVDMLTTGTLPAKKTDATLASIVSEPGESRAEMPPPEAGSQALREAAARGDARAQFIIASRYLDGQGVEQDLPKAAYWYQTAAARGLAPAQYRLATLFERGKGVPQDVATALLWYERAAEGGNVKAMHNAAVIAAGNQVATPNYDKSFKWFKAAADRGLHDSQFNLAVLYERGLGTRIDKTEAYFWYAMAAKQGDQDAARRADGLARAMAPDSLAAVTARLASWAPLASSEQGNTVAVADPLWNDATPAAAAVPSVLTADPSAPPIAMDDAAPANPVAEAQSLLGQLGFNIGSPDGKMGNRTANAIRLFQLQSGLKVTGEVTPDLLEAMRKKTTS